MQCSKKRAPPYVDAGLYVVVPEPSCLAAFRDELPQLLADDPRAARLAIASRSLSEQLLHSPKFAPAAARDQVLPSRVPRDRILLHPHCHARAIGISSADRAVLERLGFAVEVLDAGCCGLAGSFGYNPSHEAISREIAEKWWLPQLHDRAKNAVLVIDGFSCVMQLEQTQSGSRDVAISLPRILRNRLRL